MVDAGQIETAVYWTPADVGEEFGPGRHPAGLLRLTDFRQWFRQTLLMLELAELSLNGSARAVHAEHARHA